MKKSSTSNKPDSPQATTPKNRFAISERSEHTLTDGMSNINIELYTIGGSQIQSGEELSADGFSTLLDGGLETIIRGSIETLSDSKYLKSDAWSLPPRAESPERIGVFDWLDMSVKSATGEYLFELLRDDGEEWRHDFDNGEHISALGMSAHLIVKDICDLNQIFSENWYAAKILQEYYWPKDFRENQFVLIGVLSEQERQKRVNGKKFLAGVSAEHANEKRGKLGKSADRKAERLEELLSKMEEFFAKNPDAKQFDQEDIARAALKTVAKQNPELWSQGRGQLNEYVAVLSSEQPYKPRFDRLFYETA